MRCRSVGSVTGPSANPYTSDNRFSASARERNTKPADAPCSFSSAWAPRSPAPYATDSAVRCLRLPAASMSRRTSLGLSTEGNRWGTRTGYIPTISSGRSSVTVKKNFRPVIARFQRHGRCAVVDQIELVAAQVSTSMSVLTSVTPPNTKVKAALRRRRPRRCQLVQKRGGSLTYWAFPD
ncbi:hypothetical protein PMI06_003238 [Burkholderia sp. BT03]|nr:hypothetical protein PMI06_003238 [Burkholderia sp. BT03]SKC60175.1 hypothetical protein SAMN06266956_1094 [Paraburkholderia hospita]